MTTTEPELAGCAGYTPDVDDPMRLWLLTNGIVLDAVPMWPEIEIKGDQMRIEQLSQWDREREHRLLGRPYTYMGPWAPLKVPMPDELWETYERNRGAAVAARAFEQLGRAGAAVVKATEGDALIFVIREQNDQESMEQMLAFLQGAMPGVEVTILAGVDCVMHQRRP